MIDQIKKLPEDGLKSLPETLRYIENTWSSRKLKQSCTFLTLFVTKFITRRGIS